MDGMRKKVDNWQPSRTSLGIAFTLPLGRNYGLEVKFHTDELYKLAYLPGGVGTAIVKAVVQIPKIHTGILNLYSSSSVEEAQEKKKVALASIDRALQNLDLALSEGAVGT